MPPKDGDDYWRWPSRGEDNDQLERLVAEERERQNKLRQLSVVRSLGAGFRELEEREQEQIPVDRRRHAVRRRLIAAPGSAIAIALAFVLFFGSGGPAGALSVLNRAPAAAIRSKSVRFGSTILITVNGQTRRAFTEHGELDFADGSYGATLVLTGAGGGLERRSIGGVLYTSQVGRGGETPDQRRWVGARLAKSQRGTLAALPGSDALTDPRALLRILGHLQSPSKRIGTGMVDGTTTTEYRVTTTLSALLRASSESLGGRLDTGRVKAELDVWIDQEGRPRRVAERLVAPSAAGAVTLLSTTTFTGYGQSVTVAAPRASRKSPTSRPLSLSRLGGAPTRIFESLLLPRQAP
jgi:hypothetical protein